MRQGVLKATVSPLLHITCTSAFSTQGPEPRQFAEKSNAFQIRPLTITWIDSQRMGGKIQAPAHSAEQKASQFTG